MLKQIDRIILRVENVQSAVAYYRDGLGLPLIKAEPHMASFTLGQSELVLHDNANMPFEQVYYRVDDVRELYRRRSALKLTFVEAPRQISRGYKAAVKDPFGTVLQILDRSTESVGPGTIENASASGALFPGDELSVPAKRELLSRIYEKIGRTADDLPYTPEFERLFNAYEREHGEEKPTRRETWRHLLNLRKAGKLPKLGDARTQPPEVDPQAFESLKKLVGKGMGRRDRLPYSPEFENLVDTFNKTQPRPLSPHIVWRLVARLAK